MMFAKCYLLILLAFSFIINIDGLTSPCNKQTFDQNSFVCVCDEDYCDYLDNPGIPSPGDYTRIISSRDDYRFEIVNGTVTDTPTGSITIFVTHNYEYQTIKGFGGAFTDSAGLNVVKLPAEAQDHYIKSYFAPDGLQYSMCRIPIAGSDFSTYAYSYDDVDGDVDLVNFALTYEDFNYKLPLIKKAIEVSNRNILLFGSPWAPPAWMKENGMANGTGGLLREMWDPYSNYLVKFVQAYESYNLTIWGITPQNEPLTGFEDWPWNTCAWTAEDMRDWIKTSMGPIFTAAGLRRVQVMLLDHNRDALPDWPGTIIEDVDANQYVDGIAVHWYADNYVLPDLLVETQALFPDKFLLYTEACEGWDGSQAVMLGNWDRAQNYAYNIMDDLNAYCTGWVDWNMALDMGGGPNWANNFVDSPIIINADDDEFYKQPMFYAMGHFSKFLNPGAKRIYSSVEGTDAYLVRSVAFHNTDDTDVIIVMNTNELSVQVSIKGHDETYVDILMNPRSIETIIVNTKSTN